MKSMNFDRLKILGIVKTNRDKHRAEYADAVKDYKILAIEAVKQKTDELLKRIDDLKRGEKLYLHHVTFDLQVPEDHTKEYDQAILMLEMCVDDKIVIGGEEFACYVQDEWGWKDQFQNTYYSNKTSAMALTSARL